MKRCKARNVYLVLMLILSVLTGSLSGYVSSALAATTAAPVNLGAAAPFGVFGGPFGMTNQGIKTVVNGDIGTTGAASLVTGFHDTSAAPVYTETPSNAGFVTGTIHTATTPLGSVAGLIASNAALAAQTAYDSMIPGNLPNGTVVPSENLGSLTLYPGVYKSASGSFIMQGGDLTLDAQGDPNAVWVFQMSGTLLVGGPGAAFPRSIILAGNAQAKNVFWQVGSFATINAGGGGTMVGTIIASAGAAFSTPGNVAIVTLNGRALGLNASVTLVNTVINVPAATLPQPATVSSAVPVNAATGVAIGNKLSVTFSGAMDPATINTSTFTVKQGLVPVSGTVTYSGVTAVFTPDVYLASNSPYTATITSGAKGLTGGALASDFVWSFTTGTGTEVINPTVSSTVPANAGTVVPTGSKLTATFSEAMDPATISATTFTLKQGEVSVSGTVAYSGVTAVFTPTSNLAVDTTYTATITTGAKDLAVPGNAVASDFVWSFTTGTAADVITPVVTLLNPADAATGVAIGSKFDATFSEAMDPLTITVETFTLQQGATAVSGTVNYSAGIAVFTPMSDLEYNTVYTATITTGVKDLAGNVLASNKVWSFTAGSPLAITTTTLANGAVNAAYNQIVAATAGTTPYTWSATGLPSGLTINTSTGVISGTPANIVPVVTFATFPVSITVTDSAATPATANTVLNLRINQTAPAAPSLLTATASSPTQVPSVTLTWTDNAINESGVQVQRATDSGFTTGLTSVTVYGTTLTTYTDNTVASGITYYYRVRSGNSVAFSTTFSNTATVITPVSVLAFTTTSLANGAVNAVYNRTVTAINGTTPYIWSATGLPSGLSINPATGVISGTPANIVPGATFATFSVSITVQDSAATPATATSTLNLRINQSAPAAPSGLAATASSPTQVVLTWTDNANNESGVQVQRATDSGFTTGLTSVTVYGKTLATYADNTVASGITYYYRVRSGNSVAFSTTFSNTVNVAIAKGPALVNLGTAGNFVILAKTGVSTTGTTAVVGDIGLSPAAASFITGFGLIADSTNTFSTSSLVTGKVYASDYAPPTPTIMTTAIGDMQTAFTDAAGRVSPDFTELGAGDISGKTLVPGLYKWGTGVSITNGVTLSGGANDVWIFQIAQDLLVNNSAIVTLVGGAQAKNIFWQVSGKATLGTAADFKGNILSQTLISLNTGAVMNGRALAQTAVTLDATAITAP